MSKARMAVIGECLIELSGTEFGTLRQSIGGDTLNTAVYFKRLAGASVEVDYITAIGSDTLSDGMMQLVRTEGIDVGLMLRDPHRLPGLYQIQVDDKGERRFLYWRRESAARHLLQHADFDRVRRALADAGLIYLSAISLAILPPEDRAALTGLLLQLASRGICIAFDTNYRASLWPSVESARAAVSAILPATRMLFATFDDERSLWGDATVDATLCRYREAGVPSLIIKRGAAGCDYGDGVHVTHVPAAEIADVVDTTAAGDSFNAAFLAAHVAGMSSIECCETANAFAGLVIRHRGAIIPASATPPLSLLISRQRAPGGNDRRDIRRTT